MNRKRSKMQKYIKPNVFFKDTYIPKGKGEIQSVSVCGGTGKYEQ